MTVLCQTGSYSSPQMRRQCPAMSVLSTFSGHSALFGTKRVKSKPLCHASMSWLPVTKSFSTTWPSGVRFSGNTRLHASACSRISSTSPRSAMSPQWTTASTFWLRKYSNAATRNLSVLIPRRHSLSILKCVSAKTPKTRFGLPPCFQPEGAANNRHPPSPNAAAPSRKSRRVMIPCNIKRSILSVLREQGRCRPT